jgi:polysaccharide export outer membrane protein
MEAPRRRGIAGRIARGIAATPTARLALGFAGLAALLAAAWSGSPASAAAGQAPDAYVLGAGDQLEITVLGEPDLSRTVTIQPDGVIALPLISQVQAAGKTAGQLTADLRRLYRRYLKAPVVSVIVRQFQMHHVYVMGEVARPGRYDLTDGMTFLDALTLAGGPTDKSNLDGVQIARTENGRRTAIPIKARETVQGRGGAVQNPELRNGDLIYVPRRGLGIMDILNNIGILRMVLGL